MWPFKKKQPAAKSIPASIPTTREIGGIKIVREDRIITQRPRSEADLTKLEILKALLDIIGSEDIDSMFVAMLEEARALGYNLKDDPQTLLQRLKRTT